MGRKEYLAYTLEKETHMKNINHAFRKIMTTNLNWPQLLVILLGKDKRNALRKEVALRMLDRKNYAGSIKGDKVDDKLASCLDIKQVKLGGIDCVTWSTD